MTSKQSVVGAKFVKFHVCDVDKLFKFEDRFPHRDSIDSGFDFRTGIRDWQLDFMSQKERMNATVILQTKAEERGWKISRIGNTAEIYTDL